MQTNAREETGAGNLQSHNVSSLREATLRGFSWSVLAEISTRAIQPIVTLVLAHLLTPSDFGIVAVATAVISFSQLLQDFGFGKAVIQTEYHLSSYANNAFWMNILLGSLLYGVILFFASDVASALKSPESKTVLGVLCAQLPLTSLSVVHASLLQRSAQFNKLFTVRLIGACIPGLVSIPFAFAGFGVWALVGGALAGTVAQLAMYWKLSEWRPKFSFDPSLVKEMVRFSRWIAIEGIAGWFIFWGDSLVLGYFLGVSDLGYYRIGMSIVIFLSNVFFTPFVPVSFSFLSRLQSNSDEFQKYFLKISRIIAVIVLPIGMIVALFAEPIIVIFFSNKWRGVETVLSIMSIRWALGCLVGLHATGFTSLGRPDVNARILGIAVLLTLPVYILAAPYGLFVFCLARLLTALMENVLSFVYGLKIMYLAPIYFWETVKAVFIPIVLSSAIAALYVFGFGVQSVVSLILGIGLSASVYAAAFWFFHREFSMWGIRYALRLIKF